MDKLVKANNGLTLAEPTSLTLSEQKLMVMMDALAENAKQEPSVNLTREFKAAFSRHPPEAIEWAFRQQIRSSKFYPALSEMEDLFRRWYAIQREEKIAAEMKANRTAREGGECVSLKDVLKKCNEIAEAKKFPHLSAGRKEELKSKLLSSRKAGGRGKPERSAGEKLNRQAGPGEIQQSESVKG